MHELKIVREKRKEYGPPQRFRSSADVFTIFRDRFEKLDREEFVVLLLDAKNTMLDFNVVSVGALTTTIVHPREVFKPALLTNAANIILMHNHPSGDPSPSQEDLTITKRLRETGEIMGIRVLDHLIFGDGQYLSFVDDGYWDRL
jgi:DNA repair protein RadC